MSKLAALMGFIVLSVSYAWAQTPAPAPALGGSAGAPPAGDAAAGGGIGDTDGLSWSSS
jgi:hypothetical protein